MRKLLLKSSGGLIVSNECLSDVQKKDEDILKRHWHVLLDGRVILIG